MKMSNLSLKTPGIWYKRLGTFLWYDCILLFYAGILTIVKEFCTRPPIPNYEEIEKRTGQVAVLTGGPRGLALGLIKRLVQLDYTVIMGVRNVADGEKRLKIFAELNKDISLNKITLLEMDLMSLNSVRAFAKNILQETSRIDLLLCNAAIMKAPYELTVDGYESQFQVNFLSNFLLTHLLLESLKKTAKIKTGSCQIIYTSSVLHQYGTFNVDEFERPSVYTPFKFYYPSKLYPVISMLSLQRLLMDENAGVYLYAVHPGLIPTDLWFTGTSYLIGLFGQFAKRLFRTMENGADTILWPVLSPKYENLGGIYMESGSSIAISDQCRNTHIQDVLYRRSLELAGIS